MAFQTPPTVVEQVPEGPESLANAFSDRTLTLASRSVHADDYMNSHQAVAPALHVSTTFRYAKDPDRLVQWENLDPNAPYDSHIYSRDSAPNTTRLEALLASALGGPTLTYSSGLAAFHAMMVRLNPRRVAMTGGYHGCHGVVRVLNRLSGLKMVDLDCPDSELSPGDVIHVETPVNPTGEARDLDFYSAKASRIGAYLTVDATFGPPPLQDPFVHGADIIMHSGTKYIGGHSDLLCGVLAVNPKRADEGWVTALREERLFLGSVMGSMEGWLGVRSMRTLELRVQRQSVSADRLVTWLDVELKNQESVVAKLVASISHASLQSKALDAEAYDKANGSDAPYPSSANESLTTTWLRKQMPHGFGPVFAILMRSESFARQLPSRLHLFHHATSLGGVESLIEWRVMSDKTCDRRLLRVSVGVEDWEDLRADLLQAFEGLLREEEAGVERKETTQGQKEHPSDEYTTIEAPYNGAAKTVDNGIQSSGITVPVSSNGASGASALD